ncbi:IS4 family transposase [Lactococcus lactis]|uniref:IS4 family transposase n=1 Tax=Lactococcus lactis TaxID=1358 RepID=UPI003878330C
MSYSSINSKNSSTVESLKRHLENIIQSVVTRPEVYSHHPTDFSRRRKLSFETTLKLLLAMEGKSLASELLNFFDFIPETPSVSAFVQARNKIKNEALERIFDASQTSLEQPKTYKGYRLLAHDGSDINIPYDKNDRASIIGGRAGKEFSLLHLNALYDPLCKKYLAIDFQKKRKSDERLSLCEMIDHQEFKEPSIILADRGYESSNVYEHINRKDQKFVIRVKDLTSNGFLSHKTLPQTETFDLTLQIQLTRRQSTATKKTPNIHFLSTTSKFDYLPLDSKEFYPMRLRVVRIKLDEKSYEALITNLERFEFSVEELKTLYHFRWGIETSFRELKYALGLAHLHSKKESLIIQEIYARLIMYNFSMAIAYSVSLDKKKRKHRYQVNFTQVIGICRKYFLFEIEVEVLIQRYILPIRENRSDPRKLRNKGFSGFLYRVA